MHSPCTCQTNCLSEVIFTQALADAEALDTAYKREGKVVGPLHGLPVSLKDQFRVRDTETSLGYVGWLGKKETAESESWVVQRLRELGAIVFVKTNVPSSLMVWTASFPYNTPSVVPYLTSSGTGP